MGTKSNKMYTKIIELPYPTQKIGSFIAGEGFYGFKPMFLKMWWHIDRVGERGYIEHIWSIKTD